MATIKELAEQAGFDSASQTVWAFDNFDLERFAELIRQDEREKFADKYLEANYKYASLLQAVTDPENQPSQFGTVTDEYMEQAVLKEREACANVADEFDDDVGQAISRAIRARSNHEQT